ncbi:MAG: Nitrilase/cyanide hydratase and apolipoprotein N-acyltransferase [Promethearchaeota archaeon]|nr:MAG: Nitrilase/cyanide hydratase and apolipoprotein N-acyltransferase [Candidatus Lokiarchaeota archaeon]
MKIAAVQLEAEFANVKKNLQKIRRLATQAFEEGAEWVILPEFFTSGMGYHPKMHSVIQAFLGEPLSLLMELAENYNGVIGGSFLAQRGSDIYNSFLLVFPDKSLYIHDKDQPTMWENCYYIGGSDEGILKTNEYNVGVALCWEFIRSRTPKRLLNNIDFLVGGSCWWTLPEQKVPGFPDRLLERNREIMFKTPQKLAKMLGVHVIHAAHAGDFKCDMPLMPSINYKSYYLGETQIVDGAGKILDRLTREDGEGFIMKDVNPKRKWEPTEVIPKRFWIPKLPFQFRLIWFYQNLYGKYYYYRTNTRSNIRFKDLAP